MSRNEARWSEVKLSSRGGEVEVVTIAVAREELDVEEVLGYVDKGRRSGENAVRTLNIFHGGAYQRGAAVCKEFVGLEVNSTNLGKDTLPTESEVNSARGYS